MIRHLLAPLAVIWSAAGILTGYCVLVGHGNPASQMTAVAVFFTAGMLGAQLAVPRRRG